ncbi:MAG: hypothetical protein HY814_03815 [Candidatus Riflebacteria bacterium]|nr:hypothetical protein [Candidatus Riflebacteria bacterium]
MLICGKGRYAVPVDADFEKAEASRELPLVAVSTPPGELSNSPAETVRLYSLDLTSPSSGSLADGEAAVQTPWGRTTSVEECGLTETLSACRVIPFSRRLGSSVVRRFKPRARTVTRKALVFTPDLASAGADGQGPSRLVHTLMHLFLESLPRLLAGFDESVLCHVPVSSPGSIFFYERERDGQALLETLKGLLTTGEVLRRGAALLGSCKCPAGCEDCCLTYRCPEPGDGCGVDKATTLLWLKHVGV